MSAALLRHARNQAALRCGGGWRGRGRRLIAGIVAVVLVVFGVQVAAAPTGAPAAADPTGTGGQFVPIPQATLVNNTSGVGFSGDLTATPRVITVNGAAGLPTSNVAAIVATVSIINPSSSNGWISAEANTGGSAAAAQTLLNFEEVDGASNTVVIENGDDGKIKLWAAGATIPNIQIDVQGYFTTGNGAPAPGGYVSGLADLGTVGPLSSGQTSSPIQATGVGQIPITATAIYANLEVDSTASTGPGEFVAFPSAATTPPPTTIRYEFPKKVSIGTIIDLDAQGKFSIKMTNANPSVPIKVNVLGYFDGQPSNPAWTPLGYRLLQTNSTNKVAAGTTRDVQVAGAQGVPADICNAAGVVFHVMADSASAPDGSVTVWPSDESTPTAASMNFSADAITSNTVITRVGCTDGKIKVRNNSTSGSINVIVDAQSYFTNSNVVGPASGSAVEQSGSRGSQQPSSRSINDRTQVEVNPTNGNLLVTQQLLGLKGVGPAVGIGVRYNSFNDFRPTLNMGLFETQLYRNSDGSMRYTDGKGTAFKFVETGSTGVFNVPNDINAHLTRTVNGSPNWETSPGATYELVFHPAQVKNVYISDGANLQLVRTEDVTGQNKITYTYAGGKLTKITDTQGRVVNFGYSASPNPTQPTTITDTSLNRTITLVYGGPKGALTKVTDATGQQTTWAYNSANRLGSITDGSGRRTDFAYGTGSKVTSTVFGANDTAVSGTWTWAYPSSTQTTVTDSNNNTTTYTYVTATKQVEDVKDALNHSTGSVWAAHGELTKRTSALNDATNMEFATSTYNLTKVTSPTGGSGGTGAAGRTVEYTYPTAIGGGATADYRPTSVKDAEGNKSTLTYNSWGQTASEVRGAPAGGGAGALGTWSYKYQGGSGATAASCGGKSGQLCSVTDGKGNVTSYSYNTAGNVTTITYPSPLGAHTFTYDAAGRKTSEVDGKGTTTWTCYDANDRIRQVSTTSSNCGAASGVTQGYDAAGNMTSRTGAAGTATITYDAQNRPLTKTEASAAWLNSYATYDRVGNQLTSADGGNGSLDVITYRYDAANRLTSLAEPGGSCPATPSFPNSTKCIGFSYDNANRRTENKFPTGGKNTYTWDTSSRLTAVTGLNPSGGTLVKRAYTYTTGTNTDTGLVQTIKDQNNNTTTYTYDSANQLKTATVKNSSGVTTGTGTWVFDLNGNRTQQAITGSSLGTAATTNYGYNAADQLCWSGTGTSSSCTAPSGATTYTYDGQGNQTSGGNSYNGFDQLTGTTSGGTASLTYAGVSNNERTQAGGTGFTTNLASGQVGQRTTSSSGEKYIREPNGTLVAWHNDPGASFYYTLDNLNSVLLVTNSSGASAAAYTYDPYGNTLSATGSEATNNPWRYTSAYLDPTGLYKMGARYYNPNTGRFTQPDPSGQEANRYAYAGNNPVTYSDPSGLDFADFLGVASDAIGMVGSFFPGWWGIGAGIVAGALGAASDVMKGKSSDEVLGGIATDVTVGVLGGALGKSVAGAYDSAQAGWGASAAYGVATTSAQVGEDYCSENAC
ncbi:RHS repeat-associated core domain-containing protein [Nakamurella flava]|uniref:RHS repeat-associated core domain-containing protein n=1 Tax=Nakamurella flava TaxID=2576308 RepID=A0A4U6QAP2_9ACTN|nr:RHS repeat-associated core domain-containing protein [Nakamurella flava]TKV57001.1 RHS repeat-associated core domain-containing protein [Nakamurella flava]